MEMPRSANLVFERRIKGHLPVTRLAVSNSGEVMIAVPDEVRPRLYHLLRIAAAGEWSEISEFSVEKLQSVDFSGDGSVFVAITDDDVYVFREGAKTRFFTDRRETYSAVSVSASGDLFVVGLADMILSSHSVTLASTSRGAIWVKDMPFSVAGARISADARRILVGSEEGSAVLLDNQREVLWQLDWSDSITAMAISNSGEVSVVGTKSGAVLTVGESGNRLFDETRGTEIVDCALSGDGKLIAVARGASPDSGIVEFFCDDGTPVLEHSTGGRIASVACSQDGAFTAISCKDGTLLILEITQEMTRACAVSASKALLDDGCAALDEGDCAAAVDNLAKYLESCPGDVDACRKLIEAQDALIRKHIEEAERLISEGDSPRAAEDLEAAATIRPYDTGVFPQVTAVRERLISDSLDRVASLAKEGKFEEALAKAEAVIRLDLTNLRAREILGRLESDLVVRYLADAEKASAAGKSSRAVQLLEKAAAIQPTPEVHARLTKARAAQALDAGLALYEAKKFSQAVFQFRKALSLDPGNAEAQKHIEYAEGLRQDDTLFDRFSKLE